MALENEALIQIADVYRIYDSSGTDIPVLKGISLSVYPEDKLVIVGPSGSGKTTLMSIMTGFNRPSAGQVYWSVADREINKLSQNQITKYRRNFIGFINQETQLFPHLTIKENILISAKLAGMKNADYLDQYKRLVSLLNIEELVSRKKSHHTSRGEAKRISIAATLITNPKILIGDEPVGDLDPVSANEILNLFDVINEELSTSFILTSHDQAVAKRSRRAIEIRDGILSGAHDSQINLMKLEDTRRLPLDATGRISLPPEILQKLGMPNFLHMVVHEGKIILEPDMDVDSLFINSQIRTCQNCSRKSHDEFCGKCGYPTIITR